MGTFLLNPIIGITPKSIYPISYVNSGEPRWGNASSSPFRRLPQYLFHTSSIHITTYPIATTQPQNQTSTYYDIHTHYAITQYPHIHTFVINITTSVPHNVPITTTQKRKNAKSISSYHGSSYILIPRFFINS